MEMTFFILILHNFSTSVNSLILFLTEKFRGHSFFSPPQEQPGSVKYWIWFITMEMWKNVNGMQYTIECHSWNLLYLELKMVFASNILFHHRIIFLSCLKELWLKMIETELGKLNLKCVYKKIRIWLW